MLSLAPLLLRAVAVRAWDSRFPKRESQAQDGDWARSPFTHRRSSAQSCRLGC